MKANKGMTPGTKLSKVQMRKFVGGLCNPAPYYNQPCSNDYQCGGPSCYTTLYCYKTKGASVGVCLFR
jgi:hypothetical protein